jgi:predicted deacetylase
MEEKKSSYSVYAQRYYFKNKERIAEKIRLTNYQNDYYHKNKDIIRMKRKEARDRKKALAAPILPVSPADTPV